MKINSDEIITIFLGLYRKLWKMDISYESLFKIAPS